MHQSCSKTQTRKPSACSPLAPASWAGGRCPFKSSSPPGVRHPGRIRKAGTREPRVPAALRARWLAPGWTRIELISAFRVRHSSLLPLGIQGQRTRRPRLFAQRRRGGSGETALAAVPCACGAKGLPAFPSRLCLAWTVRMPVSVPGSGVTEAGLVARGLVGVCMCSHERGLGAHAGPGRLAARLPPPTPPRAKGVAPRLRPPAACLTPNPCGLCRSGSASRTRRASSASTSARAPGTRSPPGRARATSTLAASTTRTGSARVGRPPTAPAAARGRASGSS